MYLKKMQCCTSAQPVLKNNYIVQNSRKVLSFINRLGREFEYRFCDFDQLGPCVSFIPNPLMQVNTTCLVDQPDAMFSLDAGQVEIEILTLKTFIHLKAHQGAPNSSLPCGHRKVQSCMHSSYESCLLFWFNLSLWTSLSDINFIKNKHTILLLHIYKIIWLSIRFQYTDEEHAAAHFPLTDHYRLIKTSHF